MAARKRAQDLIDPDESQRKLSDTDTLSKSSHKREHLHDDTITTRGTGPALSNVRGLQAVASGQLKSSGKQQRKCGGCQYVGVSLLSHIGKKKECEAFNDVEALRAESKESNKEAARRRSKSDYQIPEKKEAKKEAARRLYHDDPEKKKNAMDKYNEKHRDDINAARRERYFKSRVKSHMSPSIRKFNRSNTTGSTCLSLIL